MTPSQSPEPPVRLNQLPPNPKLRPDHLDGAQRLDPYWGGMWNGSAVAAMTTWAAVAREARAAGHTLPARDRQATPQQARLAFRDRRPDLRHRRLKLLAFIAAYGPMTNQQLAAFLDCAQIARHATDLDLAFIAGLVMRGWPAGSSLARRNSRCPVDIYGPARNPRAIRSVFDLQFAESVHCGVTDRFRWTTASHHPRHDVLAAELALRIAEGVWEHICLVLGETSARIADIAVHSQDTAATIGQRHADLLLYRTSDLLPIAVELTNNVGENFESKLDAYAEALAYRARDDDGYAVLYVEAAHPHQSNAIDRAVRAQMHKVATRHVGRAGDRVAERLLYVRWRDWFPRHHEVRPNAFTRLRAERVVNGRWEVVDLVDLGQVPFNRSDGQTMFDRFDRHHVTWAIPVWQRDESLGCPYAEPLVDARMEAFKRMYYGSA